MMPKLDPLWELLKVQYQLVSENVLKLIETVSRECAECFVSRLDQVKEAAVQRAPAGGGSLGFQ